MVKRNGSADKAAQRKITEYFLSLNKRHIEKLAERLADEASFEKEDLVQEGAVGFLMAMKRLKLYGAKTVSQHFSWWISVYMVRAIMKRGSLIHIPEKIKNRIDKFKDNGEKDLLLKAKIISGKLGATVAKLTGLTEEIALNKIEYTGKVISPRVNFDAAQEARETGERAEVINKVLRGLNKQEEEVIRMRFGINPDQESFTLEETGEKLGGLSRERIRQIEKKALKKLGHPSLRKFWEDLDFYYTDTRSPPFSREIGIKRNSEKMAVALIITKDRDLRKTSSAVTGDKVSGRETKIISFGNKEIAFKRF